MPRMDEPVRALLERIAGPAARGPVDLDAIGAAILAFAADREYLDRWIGQLGADGGSLVIEAVPSGPRLTLVRRPEGHLSAVHDHGTWVAIAPVEGREFHRRWEIGGAGPDAAPLPVDVRSVEPGSFVTLLPPDDLHDHGHVLGQGRPADLVILTGADQTLFARTEWDPRSGRHRTLAPGEGGRWLASEPFPF
jgi:hypothetical protein